MSSTSERIFREAAVNRLASPDQLDKLIVVTRPFDWVAAAVIGLGLVVLLAWAVLGRVSTTAPGDGILLGEDGVMTASSLVGGRIASVNVRPGDRVARGDLIAALQPGDLDDRRRSASASLQQRQAELLALSQAADREARAESTSDAARRVAYAQTAAAAQDRARALGAEVTTTEDLVRRGLATEPDLRQARADLAGARERAAEARNAGLALEADRLERNHRRSRDLLAAQFRVDDARRDVQLLDARVGREAEVRSPVAGRVSEVSAKLGAVVGAGAPIAAIESGRPRLQVTVYLPASTGAQVRPGMQVRIEPSSIKREEFGALLGRVSSVSSLPSSPEAIAATVQNADLSARFRLSGPAYAAVVQLVSDPDAPTGYRWTSGHGPPGRLSAGVLAHAEVIVRERAPIELLLPLLRRKGGLYP